MAGGRRYDVRCRHQRLADGYSGSMVIIARHGDVRRRALSAELAGQITIDAHAMRQAVIGVGRRRGQLARRPGKEPRGVPHLHVDDRALAPKVPALPPPHVDRWDILASHRPSSFLSQATSSPWPLVYWSRLSTASPSACMLS